MVSSRCTPGRRVVISHNFHGIMVIFRMTMMGDMYFDKVKNLVKQNCIDNNKNKFDNELFGSLLSTLE